MMLPDPLPFCLGLPMATEHQLPGDVEWKTVFFNNKDAGADLTLILAQDSPDFSSVIDPQSDGGDKEVNLLYLRDPLVVHW